MATTVREMIELLRDYPANAHVAIAKDASGSSFAPFEEITEEDLDLEEKKPRFEYESEEEDEGHEDENEMSMVVLWPSR